MTPFASFISSSATGKALKFAAIGVHESAAEPGGHRQRPGDHRIAAERDHERAHRYRR